MEDNVRTATHLWGHTSAAASLLRTRAFRTSEAEVERVVDESLEMVRLAPRRRMLARALSCGAQRGLEVAVALATRARLVLLDEPAAGLTAEETEHLRTLILGLRARGLTRILVELRHGRDRLPVAPHELAHRRAPADPRQRRVLFRADHRSLPDRIAGRHDLVERLAAPVRFKTIQDIAFAAYTNHPQGMEAGLEAVSYYDPPNLTSPFGSYICVVDIDKGTGEVKIRRFGAVADRRRDAALGDR